MARRIAGICALLLCISSLRGQESPKPAEAVFANIKVLQGLPSTQLLPVMHFMRASLGVGCEFCHVAQNDQYRLDVKKEKERAREMIVMTRRINELGFGGRNVVTCETCHRGTAVPDSIPEVRSIPAAQPPPAPSVSEILSRFEELTHAGRLPPVRVTLNGCRAKVVDGVLMPRADCSTRVLSIDGNQSETTSSLPDGQTIRAGSDGHRGWIETATGLRSIAGEEFARWERSLNPLVVVRVRPDDLSSSRVEAVDTIDGREAYRIEAVGQTLWFSKATGLLVRRTFYHPIALGFDPEQFDLSDYRRFGPATLPARINTSYLDDQHLGVLRTILAVKPAKSN